MASWSAAPEQEVRSAPRALSKRYRRQMAELRRRYLAHVTQELIAKRGRVHALRVGIKFPLRALRESYKAVEEFGADVELRHGVSTRRQLVQVYALRLRFGLLPDSYYKLRLFLPARRAEAWAYIEPDPQLQLMLNAQRRSPRTGAAILKDKRRFAAWCAEHDLPTAAVLEIVTPDRHPAPPAAFPPADLFSKPADTNNGIGVCLWLHQPADDGMSRWRDAQDVYGVGDVDAAGLRAALAAAPSPPHLIQRRLTNHAGVADLTSGALSTARVVTLHEPNGGVVVFRATYRMPTGRSAGDNFTQGGLAAPIDPMTGRLGTALLKHTSACVAETETHPDTGARISDRMLPLWPEVRELVGRAHSALPDLHIVGWDVAITPTGPALVEGNYCSGPLLTQMPSGEPMGNTIYTRHLLATLRQADL